MAAFESKKYSWKDGYSFKVSAEIVGNALEEIQKEKGHATSVDFLEYSRDEESETHDMFEWDDTVAAEKYRLHQSGVIINQLQVEIVYTEVETDDTPIAIEDAEPRTIKANAWVNVGKRWTQDKTEKATYIDVVSAMNDVDNRKQVLFNASRELSVFKRKYQLFKELAKVVAEIDNFQKALEES